MPQSGPRGCPDTERRNVLTPACAIAAATTVPCATVRGWPFIERWMWSDMVCAKPENRKAESCRKRAQRPRKSPDFFVLFAIFRGHVFNNSKISRGHTARRGWRWAG